MGAIATRSAAFMVLWRFLYPAATPISQVLARKTCFRKADLLTSLQIFALSMPDGSAGGPSQRQLQQDTCPTEDDIAPAACSCGLWVLNAE